MKSVRGKVKLCERCQKEAATTARAAGTKGEKLLYRQLCKQCFEIELATGPQTLQGLIDMLEGKDDKDQAN